MRSRVFPALLLTGLVLAGAMPADSPCAVESTALAAKEPVSLRALYANIYVQTSAEYRACCRTIYTCAGRQLEQSVARTDPQYTKPAVVMDLDETVIDNAAFQSSLYQRGLEYTPELWAEFERSGVARIGAVPGALEFIEHAESLGVTVVYLSNRNERNIDATSATLERLGINGEDLEQRLFLKPTGGSSSKTARRDAVSAQYNVLMYFGDNLRDFSEVFRSPGLPTDPDGADYRSAIAARKTAVDDAACHWGVDWFVLPNPVYGEWEKLVPEDPAEVLTPPVEE